MQKVRIATYFVALVITMLLMSLTLLNAAKNQEKSRRANIEALAQALIKTSGDNLNNLKAPLATYLGNNVLLTVESGAGLKFHWQSSFAATGDSIVWIIVIGLPFIFLCSLILMPMLLYKLIIVPQTAQIAILKSERKSYESMQMFAHDVRKPFSALKALLNILNKRYASGGLEAVVQKLLPEVDTLLGHVDGMISDLLINSTDTIDKSESLVISLDKILDNAVTESAKKHSASELPITWNLQHSLKPAAPEKALVRCFSNLICNAIEAIGPEERLWIKSRDSKINGAQAIEVTIGNSGRAIPKEILVKLFTPFFTSGKSGGTGLGLAYVKKTLDELKGYAAVRSDETRGTEFILTIPASSILDKVTRSLPKYVNPRSHKETIASSSSKVLQILVVEDQDIYFESLKSAIHDQEEIDVGHTLHHVKTYNDAVKLMNNVEFDLVICDVDLGETETSGIDVIKALKSRNSKAKIHIYSNKSLTSTEQRYAELSTDGNMRKPANTQEINRVLAEVATGKKKLPVVAIIDDDCFVRELWSMQNDVIEAHLFASPEEFFLKMNTESTFLCRFDAIIVDYYFAEDSEYTGVQVAKKIRAEVQTPIIMASDVQCLTEDATSAINGQISKDCQSWAEVQKLMAICA